MIVICLILFRESVRSVLWVVGEAPLVSPIAAVTNLMLATCHAHLHAAAPMLSLCHYSLMETA